MKAEFAAMLKTAAERETREGGKWTQQQREGFQVNLVADLHRVFFGQRPNIVSVEDKKYGNLLRVMARETNNRFGAEVAARLPMPRFFREAVDAGKQ